MSWMLRCWAALAFAGISVVPVHAAVTFDWVEVGNPGNPAHSNGFGSVDYVYSISKYEVTHAQWLEFLNSAAKSTLSGIPIFNIESASYGIVRSGTNGNYTYSLKDPSYADKPITFVTWTGAARFVNWLHNGQGNASTDTGVYDLTKPYPTRSVNDSYVLPTIDEWFKAAYYDPNKDGVGGYWKYATQSDSPMVSEAPPGGSNSGNYKAGGIYALTGTTTPPAIGMTDVGAYTNAVSAYGTYDQGGNVWEWVEDVFESNMRGLRGGSWADDASFTSTDNFVITPHLNDSIFDYGFRVAFVPEPGSTLVMFAIGAGLLRRRRRTR